VHRLAEACGFMKVPLHYHQDRTGPDFWKAALRIPPNFRQEISTSASHRRVTKALSAPVASYVRSASGSGQRQNRKFVTSFIDQLVAFVSANAWLAYLTLFLAALLEAVPVVGSVIPGSTIILALSALIPGGELKLEGVLAAAIAGALIGDGSAFWLGHRRQREILSAWPMSNYPRLVTRSEAFFHRWGTLAVFFARFVPPIRAFVPLTAGALGMSPLRFYAVNIPAILLWAPAHVLPGVLAVSALHRYGGLPHHTGAAKYYWILAVIGVALIAWLVTWAIRRGAKDAARAPVRSDLR
jgi:membrane-associated protein